MEFLLQRLAIILAIAAVMVYGALIISFAPKIPRGCWLLLLGLVINFAQKLTILDIGGHGAIRILDSQILPFLEGLCYFAAATLLFCQHQRVVSQFQKRVCKQLDELQAQEKQQGE